MKNQLVFIVRHHTRVLLYLLQSSNSNGFSDRVISSIFTSVHLGRFKNWDSSTFALSFPRLLFSVRILATIISDNCLQFTTSGLCKSCCVAFGISARRYSRSFSRSLVTGSTGGLLNCSSLRVLSAAEDILIG